jgi:hypothetical protein
MVRFVTINKFCELTGYTRRAVEGKRQDGVWTEGCVLVKAPDGHILIDVEEFERWAASGHGKQTVSTPAMKSPALPNLEQPTRRKRNPLRPKFDT